MNHAMQGATQDSWVIVKSSHKMRPVTGEGPVHGEHHGQYEKAKIHVILNELLHYLHISFFPICQHLGVVLCLMGWSQIILLSEGSKLLTVQSSSYIFLQFPIDCHLRHRAIPKDSLCSGHMPPSFHCGVGSPTFLDKIVLIPSPNTVTPSWTGDQVCQMLVSSPVFGKASFFILEFSCLWKSYIDHLEFIPLGFLCISSLH